MLSCGIWSSTEFVALEKSRTHDWVRFVRSGCAFRRVFHIWRLCGLIKNSDEGWFNMNDGTVSLKLCEEVSIYLKIIFEFLSHSFWNLIHTVTTFLCEMRMVYVLCDGRTRPSPDFLSNDAVFQNILLNTGFQTVKPWAFFLNFPLLFWESVSFSSSITRICRQFML